jgi:hypothetical protein
MKAQSRSSYRTVQRLIVDGLERTCTLTDRLTPDVRWRLQGRVCRLAEWSFRLDERWGTGCWNTCPPRADGADFAAGGGP